MTTGELSFPQKVLALSHAVVDVPHAFGGAICLGYHAEARATVDIDLNLFIGGEDFSSVEPALAQLGITADPTDAAHAEADGQIRMKWGGTPVDLFFAYDPFHEAAERGRQRVPFLDEEIWILSATHLAVCKAVFDRPKDWLDIDAMISYDTAIDVAEVLRWVGRIAGDTDRRYDRIATVLTNR